MCQICSFTEFPRGSVPLRYERTAALVTTSSISPRCAPMSTANFSTTPSSTPNRLFSASVLRKFLTMPSLSAPPMCFWSSWMICCLSETERVGAWRISASLGSFLKTPASDSSDFAVGSRALVFAAAVYYHKLLAQLWFQPLPLFPSLIIARTAIEPVGVVPERSRMCRRRRRGPRAACSQRRSVQRQQRSFG